MCRHASAKAAAAIHASRDDAEDGDEDVEEESDDEEHEIRRKKVTLHVYSFASAACLGPAIAVRRL